MAGEYQPPLFSPVELGMSVDPETAEAHLRKMDANRDALQKLALSLANPYGLAAENRDELETSQELYNQEFDEMLVAAEQHGLLMEGAPKDNYEEVAA